VKAPAFHVAAIGLAFLLAVPARADQTSADLARDNVTYWIDHAPLTAHVRTGEAVRVGELRTDAGVVGYARFRVSATVIESFRGATPGPIEFFVVQEQPSAPPRGDFIVSLVRNGAGEWTFADDSAWWVAATPELLAAARRAAHRRQDRPRSR
jgi:hypothetical protein